MEKVPYFVVYPNPTDGALNVYSDHAIQTITVVDLSGKIVESFDVKQQKLVTLNAELNPGLYVILVELKDGEVLQTKFSRY